MVCGLGGACVVAGEPGGGASTLSWADAPAGGCVGTRREEGGAAVGRR